MANVAKHKDGQPPIAAAKIGRSWKNAPARPDAPRLPRVGNRRRSNPSVGFGARWRGAIEARLKVRESPSIDRLETRPAPAPPTPSTWPAKSRSARRSRARNADADRQPIRVSGVGPTVCPFRGWKADPRCARPRRPTAALANREFRAGRRPDQRMPTFPRSMLRWVIHHRPKPLQTPGRRATTPDQSKQSGRRHEATIVSLPFPLSRRLSATRVAGPNRNGRRSSGGVRRKVGKKLARTVAGTLDLAPAERGERYPFFTGRSGRPQKLLEGNILAWTAVVLSPEPGRAWPGGGSHATLAGWLIFTGGDLFSQRSCCWRYGPPSPDGRLGPHVSLIG